MFSTLLLCQKLRLITLLSLVSKQDVKAGFIFTRRILNVEAFFFFAFFCQDKPKLKKLYKQIYNTRT